MPAAGGPDDNNLVIWNVETGSAICGSPAAHDTCACVKWFNNDDAKVVTGGIKQLRIWDFKLGERKVRPIEVQTSKEVRNFNCIAVSDDDKVLYVGTTTGDVLSIDTEGKKMFAQGPQKGMLPKCGIQAIQVVGNDLLVGSGDGELMILDKTTLTPTVIQSVLGSVTSIAMDSHSEFFFAGTDKANMYLVQYENLVAELKTTGHAEPVADIAFAKGYSELFATCAGSDIRIWHTKTKSELLRVQVPEVKCNCIAFSPSGNAIFSGWNDGKVRAFAPQSGSLQFVINEAHRLTGVGNSSGGVVPFNGVTAICWLLQMPGVVDRKGVPLALPSSSNLPLSSSPDSLTCPLQARPFLKDAKLGHF